MDFYPLVSLVSEWLGVIAVSMLAGASPRFQRPALVFRYPQRERRFALLVSAAAVVFAFIFYAVMRTQPSSAVTLIRLLLAALCAGIAFAVLRQREQPVRSMGWGRLTLRSSVYLGLASGLLAIFLRGRFLSVVNGLNGGEITLLMLWLGISLAEETVFRGYVLPRLMSAWGAWGGVIASALIFTLYSLPFKLLLNPTTPDLLLAVAISFVQGLVLAYMVHRSGHVLAPALYRALSEWISLMM